MLRSIIVSAAACCALVSGCYAGVSSEPVGYAEVTSAPVDIETYPSTVYEGRPVYLYQDRWYYRDGARWGYYRNEPAPLYAHRSRLRPAVRTQGRDIHRDDRDHRDRR